jgi:hypothetical protein
MQATFKFPETFKIRKGEKEYVCEKIKLINLFKEHGSLQNVSEITKIPYSVLYTLFKIKLNLNVPRKVKKTKYKYNIDKLIKLFKKHGFLPHISQITGIPTFNLRNILIKEFGVGLTELRKKLGINRRCLKRRDLDKNAKRYQQVKEIYERLGTLDKVGKELNLTKERVRQLLQKGAKYGVFNYVLNREKRFKDISQKYNRDSIINEIKSSINPPLICERLGVKSSEFRNLLKYFEIDYSEYRKLALMGKYMNRYSQIVDALGHHPTTTEMVSRREWRTVWGAIDRHWGSMGNFRKEFGIEVQKYTNSAVYLKHAWEKRRQLKDEKKNKLFNFIKERNLVSSGIIIDELEFSSASISNYLRELLGENLISKVGIGSQTKYVVNDQTQ